MKKEKICGIYKITSPSGRVYIGQTIDFKHRIKNYIRGSCKSQRKLYNSIKKYGWDSHGIQIIHICIEEELNGLEEYYEQLYDSTHPKTGLNLKKGGGNRGKASEETKIKLSNAQKKVWIKRRESGNIYHTEAAKKLNSESRKVAWIKQKECELWNSPEEIKKRSERAKSTIHPTTYSNEAKENMRKGWEEYKESDEYNSETQREKRRVINLGKIPWNKGTIGVMKAWNKGKNNSEEQNKKNSKSGKKDWEKRKAKGFTWSDETLERRRVSLKRFYENKKKEGMFNVATWKVVLNIETGIFYPTKKDAAFSIGISIGGFNNRMNNNKGNFIYA